jgi:hypothetical protein
MGALLISAKKRKDRIRIARFSSSFAELKSPEHSQVISEGSVAKESHAFDSVDRCQRVNVEIHAFGVVANVWRNISTKALDWQ